MKYRIQNLFLFFLLLYIAGCASVRPQPANTLFSFEFDNSTYEIFGVTSEEGESVNFLVYRENNNTIFRVIDYNQDGILDRVITGSVDLAEANDVYQEGIRQAREQDSFREIEQSREYEISHNSYRLVVQSLLEDRQRYQNRFIIYNSDWIVLGIYWDDESDGILTRMEKGEIELSDAQTLYELILQRASEENRIEDSGDERFIITKDEPVEEIRNTELSYHLPY